jgi:hypothetical protein
MGNKNLFSNPNKELLALETLYAFIASSYHFFTYYMLSEISVFFHEIPLVILCFHLVQDCFVYYLI